MSDVAELKFWACCNDAIDWSHDGIIAFASEENVEMLVRIVFRRVPKDRVRTYHMESSSRGAQEQDYLTMGFRVSHGYDALFAQAIAVQVLFYLSGFSMNIVDIAKTGRATNLLTTK